MDELLARENAAHHYVLGALKSPDLSVRDVLAAFDSYRVLDQAVVFANLPVAHEKEAQLWDVHTQGKQYFSRRLRELRKPASGDKLVVQERDHVHLYKKFLRASVAFYREHIYKLSIAFDIPELKDVAQLVGPKDSSESAHTAQQADDASRKLVIVSCHHSLVYLGDLSRYRTSEKLDTNPDFGPAIGYYDLASAVYPRSGMGQHQQAVVALEMRDHLRTIYHLYRASCVQEPHPLAAKNLAIEFARIDTAWKTSTLIKQSKPSDPDHLKDISIGWYVRLQSLAQQGEASEGFDELQSTVVSQLSGQLKRRSLGAALHRMVVVNIAGQHTAIQNYTVKQTSKGEQAFYSSLRINLAMYSTLLEIFQDELLTLVKDAELVALDLQDKVTPITKRILPALRLYSSWLLDSVHLLFGLANDPKFAESIKKFWKVYGRTLDLVATIFPIWDLEEAAEVEYQLEEDVDIIGFQPLSPFADDKTGRFWQKKQSAVNRAKFSDDSVTRVSMKEEDLVRVYGFLEDGLYIANDLDDSPIKIKGSRVFYGNGAELEQLLMPLIPGNPAAKPVAKACDAAPMSYAAAAGSRRSHLALSASKPNGIPKLQQSASSAREEHMTRMVDDLVDDDESKDPVTPPQQFASEPAVYNGNTDFALASLRDSTPEISNSASTYSAKSPVQRPPPGLTSPWTPSAIASPSSFLPKPAEALASPGQGRGHSRVGSANSIRSRASQSVGDSWSSLEALPQGTGMANANTRTPIAGLGGYGQSALLFGATPNVWSTGKAERTFGAKSPDRGAG
ncbi:hypothetical protein B0A48_09892 [Cryoendolithus antarcticus]|uniref:DNA/RNA-binding domain-containing protein n=1 Tax=Cryoendolithus antarcticus TaxID=1507870 RepID=A0A1V8T303_9PEZI|nr:hypothetical protein B0A48_09892 [Cryoendolithus antarcticus]